MAPFRDSIRLNRVGVMKSFSGTASCSRISTNSTSATTRKRARRRSASGRRPCGRRSSPARPSAGGARRHAVGDQLGLRGGQGAVACGGFGTGGGLIRLSPRRPRHRCRCRLLATAPSVAPPSPAPSPPLPSPPPSAPSPPSPSAGAVSAASCCWTAVCAALMSAACWASQASYSGGAHDADPGPHRRVGGPGERGGADPRRCPPRRP